jgi:putative transport protein
MEVNLQELLSANVILLLFTVIGLGYLIGNIKIGKIQVGSTTGVLLAGLLFGHLGFSHTPGAGTFGFTLFIFSVGLQAGPSFFSVFLEDGMKYIALSAVVAITAVALTLALSSLVGLDYGLNAGLLAGALTSTPTLAGASDAVRSGLAAIPEGITAEQASNNISVAYAITYLFGTVGLIVFIRYFPVILRIDLPAEARKVAEKKGLHRGRRRDKSEAERMPIIRAYQVSDDHVGKTVEQVHMEKEKRFRPLRIRRGSELLEPEPGLELKKGDIASIVASLGSHQRAQEYIGKEVLDTELLNYQIASREIVVTNSQFQGKPVKDLNLISEYGCFATGLTRSAIDLPMDDNLILNKGDRLRVTGEEGHLEKLADAIGYVEEQIEETDLLTFAFGIVVGIALGMILIKIGNLSVGLGSAGGLLLTGILFGFLRSVHPTFGKIPAAARFILMELGLMLFMANVGLKAGSGVVEALTAVGPSIIICGIVVTLSPVIIGYFFGTYVLKLGPAILLGAITGAMTSTPSLNIVTTAARSSVPALGYAGTYTFANVFLTFAGTIIMTL